MELIHLQEVSKIYEMGKARVVALDDVSFSVEAGEYIAIMGPSGSGKSTCMNIIGCLDRPTTGTCRLDGTDVTRLNDNQLARIRNKKVGFIFQSFNLLPRTTALENVELPLIYAGGTANRRKAAREALDTVGLGDRISHKPSELSGGEQQRVAIARALVNEPNILLADEPTGNLDSASGISVMKILQGLNERGITVIVVTHDQFISKHSGRVIQFFDGKVVSDSRVSDRISYDLRSQPVG